MNIWNEFFERVNRWRTPYDYKTDSDGVEWRIDTRRIESPRVKVYDPNFVHDRVPTPKILDYMIYGLAVLIVLLVGIMVGSAL